MITRRVALYALWCLVSIAHAQYIPISSAADENDCALYLSGPGRSSAFDYNLNLLKGSFPYDGQHTCITYDAVNAAYIEARKRINVATPKGDWKTEDIASVGELMLDISISLARTYGLTYEDIEKGLPLIDTSKTLIREVCPPFLAHVECRAGKYRRFDGLCTNLEHPTWGAAMTPFQRLIAPLYADGINSPRVSVTGKDLPLSRIVSRTMHPDDGFHDHAGTVMVIAWGQFMDHDYTLTGTPLDPFNRNDPEECCNRPPHQKHPYCNELRIPDDDYFYRLFNIKCIDFVRGFPSPRAGCRLGSRQQFNTLTSVIDGNTVYGVTEKFSRKLRSGFGGLLRMNPVFEEYGLKDLLPLKLDIPDEGCTRPNRSMYCFEAGEIRVNEQLVLTCMHTLMAREHNRVAKGLAHVNPHWDDETLFQESRRIIIAQIQHITYNEFLPILLGKEVMEKFGLLLQKDGFWEGYDPNINPAVIDAFAAAAFRFGHSLLPTAVERWSKAHKFIASKRLSDLIRRPYDLYRAGVFDEYLMGLMNQVAQAMDDSITQEVTNHLFKKPGARFGMDLVSFNMQRGREFGLPGYMEFRKFCGLPAATNFQELFGSMPNETIQRYESIFDHPSDVDLWSGGVSERPLPGSMLGPTFACIIATQFSYSRRGDRFWYELPNQPSSFTPEQLQEVKKARLSRVICDNTDIIDTVQVYPMVLPDHEINPRVPCRSGILPSIDFTKWADYSAQHAPAGNPYDDETKASFINTDNNKNTTEQVVKKENTTEVLEKSTGHVKNALRKKRSVVLDYNNTLLLNNATNKDSQAEAIVVTQITGGKKHKYRDVPTTEATIPQDQRDDITPQAFKPKNTNTINEYYGFEPNKRRENEYEEQVSQEQPKEKLPEGSDEPTQYNDEKFLPDEQEDNSSEENREQNEKSDQPLSYNHREYTSAAGFDNEELSEQPVLGHAGNADRQSDIPNKPTDESKDLNEQREERCPRNRRTRNSADSSGSGEKLISRVCENSDGGLERIDERRPTPNDIQLPTRKLLKRKKYKKNIPHPTSDNAKEQFENIPLDYNHDIVQKTQAENKINDKEEEKEKVKENEPNNEKQEKEPEEEYIPPGLNKIVLDETPIEIDDIILPESIFGLYKSSYFENLKNKEYKNDDYFDDSGEDNDSDNSNENEKNSDEAREQEDEEDEEDDKSSEDENDDEPSSPYKNKATQKDLDEYEFYPGYLAFDARRKEENKKSEPVRSDPDDELIRDEKLKNAVSEILEKSKKAEKDVGTDGNYFWTLEYHQPI